MSSPTWVNCLRVGCGGVAAAAAKSCLAPLNRVTIIMQNQGMPSLAFSSNSSSHHGTSHFPYTSASQALRQIIQKEGFRALWSGNGANILRVIPNYGLRFGLTDISRSAVARMYGLDPAKTRHALTQQQLVLAGCMTAVMQITLTYPLEVISTRLAVNGSMLATSRYLSIADCSKSLWQEGGLRACYNGYLITLLAGTPYIALQMSCFELFQRFFHRTFGQSAAAATAAAADSTQPISYETIHPLSKLSAGACASLLAQTLTYPGDVLRRRMQVDGMNSSSANSTTSRAYNGLLDAIVKIYRQEGYRAFFKGISVNSIRIVPEGALMFLFVDKLKRLCKIEAYDTH